MNFKEGLPIYLQIAERLSDEIVAGVYAPEARVPSVREYSVLLEVNVNTVVKAFNQLRAAGVLFDRRGLGSHVAPDAPERILAARREQFEQHDLPELVRRMHQLGITPQQVSQAYAAYAAQGTQSKE